VNLWNGSLFGSIAHAVAVSRLPFVAHEQSWDGATYRLQDSFGSRGSITFVFDEQGFPISCAGACFCHKSERTRLTSGRPLDPKAIFAACPPDLQRVVDRSLSYLLDDFDGLQLPWITCGLWTENSQLYSGDTLEQFIQHGGHLLEYQLCSIPYCIELWQVKYSLSNEEIEMVIDLYQQRVRYPIKWIALTPNQLRLIERNAKGVDEAWESFAELKIRFQADQ
jgi:hypothetical protein